ncbi:MAG: hypothetical protein M0C28_24435 [Candidatus Moduliflexus flocculans]|nr:hypothetical protein [Candidatus Moduliflexus flocculans]
MRRMDKTSSRSENLKLHYLTSQGRRARGRRASASTCAPGETLGPGRASPAAARPRSGIAILRMPTPPGRIVGGQHHRSTARDIMPLSEQRARARTSAGRRSRWSSRAR